MVQQASEQRVPPTSLEEGSHGTGHAFAALCVVSNAISSSPASSGFEFLAWRRLLNSTKVRFHHLFFNLYCLVKETP